MTSDKRGEKKSKGINKFCNKCGFAKLAVVRPEDTGVCRCSPLQEPREKKCNYHYPCGCEAQEQGLEHLACEHIDPQHPEPIPPQPEKTVKQPFTCPICLGRGNVSGGFYNGCGEYSISASTMEQCRQCKGTGIIWNTL